MSFHGGFGTENQCPTATGFSAETENEAEHSATLSVSAETETYKNTIIC